MKRTIILLVVLIILNVGCVNEKDVIPSPSPTPSFPMQTIIPEVEETEDPVNRPEITIQYERVYFVFGDGYGDYSENVISVVDKEDGDIPYEWIGGIDFGPDVSKEEAWERIVNSPDSPSVAEGYGHGFYFAISQNFSTPEESYVAPALVIAYDNEGHISKKGYEIVYMKIDEPNIIGTVRVLVDDLNVRYKPSANATKLGNVVKNKDYYVYEISNSEGYTWYRLDEDVWVADNGEWIERIS